jgi:DNA-binding XRE family transcriptional regulator
MSIWQDKISALRTMGFTLAEIGRNIGLTPQSVCDLEAGRSKEPRGTAALKLDALYQRTSRKHRRVRK